MWLGVLSFSSCSHPTLFPSDKPSVDKVMLNRIWIKKSFCEHLIGMVPSWWFSFLFLLCLHHLSPKCGQPASAVALQTGCCPHFHTYERFCAWRTQGCLTPLFRKTTFNCFFPPVFENRIQSCVIVLIRADLQGKLGRQNHWWRATEMATNVSDKGILACKWEAGLVHLVANVSCRVKWVTWVRRWWLMLDILG